MLSPTEYAELGILAIGGSDTIYQSQKLRVLSGKKNAPSFAIAQGRMVQGKMPNAFYGWGTAQALTLAYFVCGRETDVFANGQIKDEYIPDIISARAREVDLPKVLSQVRRRLDRTIESVSFWATDPTEKEVKFEHSNKSLLVGEVKFAQVDQGLPTKLELLLNQFTVDHARQVVLAPTPMATATYEGAVFHHNNTAIFDEVAYDRGTSTAVTDLRLPGRRPLQYVLTPKDKIPFDDPALPGSSAAQLAYRNAQAKRTTDSYQLQVRWVVLGIVALSAISVVHLFTRNRRGKQQQ